MNWIKKQRAAEWDKHRAEFKQGMLAIGEQINDTVSDGLERAMYIKYGDYADVVGLPDWFVENKTYQKRLLSGWYRYKKANGKKTLRGWLYWKLMLVLCGEEPEFYKVSTSENPKYKGKLVNCNPIYHLLDKIKTLEKKIEALEKPKPISVSDVDLVVSKEQKEGMRRV